jgi:hypothetical protein
VAGWLHEITSPKKTIIMNTDIRLANMGSPF